MESCYPYVVRNLDFQFTYCLQSSKEPSIEAVERRCEKLYLQELCDLEEWIRNQIEASNYKLKN
ncbi:MAG: hypothetical protein IJ186_01420 [Bacilli bacterium]|nr:hypothetical protein [Bacilli bacterium]